MQIKATLAAQVKPKIPYMRPIFHQYVPVLAALVLFAVLGCKSAPKKEPVVVPPVVAEPPKVEEPVVKERAVPEVREEEMEVAVRGALTLRSGPRRTSRALGVIPYGAKVTVLDRSGTDAEFEREENMDTDFSHSHDHGRSKRKSTPKKWYKVRYEDETGYVFAKYLREPGEKRSYTVKKRKARKRRKAAAKRTNAASKQDASAMPQEKAKKP